MVNILYSDDEIDSLIQQVRDGEAPKQAVKDFLETFYSRTAWSEREDFQKLADNCFCRKCAEKVGSYLK